MKQLLVLLSMGLLASCTVQVSPIPTPVPEVKILSVNYATNYRTADGTSVICDNRATTLLYRFRYEGPLSSWTSYLEGQTLDEVKGTRTFTPDSQGVVAFGEQGYEVQYVMSANFAPYASGAADNTPAPSAIDVVPVPQPTPIGATRLHLILEGAGQEARFVSRDIPVITDCS